MAGTTALVLGSLAAAGIGSSMVNANQQKKAMQGLMNQQNSTMSKLEREKEEQEKKKVQEEIDANRDFVSRIKSSKGRLENKPQSIMGGTMTGATTAAKSLIGR
jgi:long-subunit fatty acid transport protein